MRKARSVLGIIVVVALLMGAIGCVTERDPVDRAPKEALDKKMFEGEFFYKQTIVDLPYTVDYSFIGETNETKIIKWEINKNWLIAYNIHDKIDVYTTPDNGDGTGGIHDPNRTPILAYPILDHFDITYMDNPTTGEDMPVIVANHDRDWHERRYFMIDPSQSYVTNFEMEYLNITIDFSHPFYREPVGGYLELEFYDRDGNYLNPRTWRDHETPVEEISFYSKEIFTPNNSWRYIYSWEDVYWFINWEPANIVYRHDFVKVHRDELANNGFEPIDMQDELFRKFSFFRTRRVSYCSEMGVRDKCYKKWTNYFNINNANSEGLRDDDSQRIVYRVSPNFPRKLVPAACQIAADYNDAMKKAWYAKTHPDSTVDEEPQRDPKEDFSNYKSQNVEEREEMIERCLGSKPGVDHAFDDADDIFVLRPQEFMPYNEERDGYGPDGQPLYVEVNPCEYYPLVKLPEGYTYEMCFDDDGNVKSDVPLYKVACHKDWDNSCKVVETIVDDEGNTKKIYSLRYKHELGSIKDSFIYWIDTPTEYGILGVAQWSANPETGQIFSGVAHIAGWVVYWELRYGLDLFDILAGQKTIYDVMKPDYGQPTTKFVGSVNLDFDGTANGGGGRELTGAAREQWEQQMANLNPQEMLEKLRARFRPLDGRFDLNAIKGTKWESQMIPAAYRDYMFPDQEDLSQEQLDYISPLKFGTMEGLKDIMRRGELLTQNCFFQAEWLDGAIAKYVEEKLQIVDQLVADDLEDIVAKIKQENPNLTEEQAIAAAKETDEYKAAYDAAYQTVRQEVKDEMTAIIFKGVAEHEVGHSLGLRHNFISSADIHSYVGTAPWEDPDNYSGFWKEELDVYRPAIEQYRQDHPNASGKDVWQYGRSIVTDREKYMYASVMDYQDEIYIHSVGLGKFDYAALKFAYGKSIEKYQVDPNDARRLIKVNKRWYDDEGKIINEDSKFAIYCGNDRYPFNWLGPCEEGFHIDLVANESVPITENGNNVPYKDSPDEMRFEDPMSNVWDTGYTARDIVRYRANMYNKYYYYRFFRRGNPRFERMRHYNWWRSFWRFFPMAHFALDFNYNLFQNKDWQNVFLDNYCASRECQEYRAAILGDETNLTPGGPGDMIIAGIEGFNFLLYDVLYRPDVAAYIKLCYPEDINSDSTYQCPDDAARSYFIKNPYIIDDKDIPTYFPNYVFVGPEIGRYHRNRWDIQDDPRIIEAKLMRMGFSVEKEAAIFVLTNTGWPVEKYMRENMANSFSYVSQGFYNAVTNVIADVINEDHMVTFSPYCAVKDDTTGEYSIIKVNAPNTATYLWGAADDWGAPASAYQPPSYSLCNRVPNAVPLHAGWIYFDKLQPAYWAMYSMSNITADESVFQLFTSEVIPASQYDPAHCVAGGDTSGCGNWAPLDPTKEAEFLNVNGRYYFRARKADTVTVVTPVYEVVKRAQALRAYCDAKVGPENIESCRQKRTLEIMEATLTNNNTFAKFWIDVWGWFLL